MKNRFDLEEHIMDIWNTVADIKLATETIYDDEEAYDKDKIFHLYYGIAEILEAKLLRLENTFNQVFELNEYSNLYNQMKKDLEKETEDKWSDFFDAIDHEYER